ncbi:diacylglycerol kinase family lipid kinase [Neobacillus sp. MM2021_6]|uniref:diacylglycerol/lipid kinase family protein n=1 Tax=Bacillaceae TaxID=186817 RepID=UPI00140BB0F7|nr:MULTISPECIES: diacylglycerol kinase family protein [Bacillaceae]MBO0960333.1 diacylglycerol kinase family lipid kinase [Neobacillus sp. MM2021_6]NHC17443.1 diacylglycerol kinase family lipid kinase [Bacillus sp. MM2020_4]
MKHIYFIVNPKARNGYCLKIWERIEEQVRIEKLSYLAVFTEYPGHAQHLASQMATKNREQKLIIAVGGDGTMHEVMNGIVKEKNITLGFIPGGSGNDFSRGFQLPADPVEALQVILRLMKQEAVHIDIGKVMTGNMNEHFFINNMGAGFDAVISYEVNHSRVKALLNKLSLGRLVYVYFLLKKLFTYKTSTIDLSIDGNKHIFEQTWFVTVSNQPFYGGGMQIAPNAVPDDGLFDITVVHQLSRLKLLLVFISVFWGKHTHFKEVKTFKGSVISIHSPAALYAHADGEHIGFTPLSIHLQPKVLGVLTRRPKREEIQLKERNSNDFC